MVEPAADNVSTASVYPRDPPKNDIAVFRSAACDKLASSRYRVINHHKNSFEMNETITNNWNRNRDHRKTQHFIRGKIPGGSHDNSLIYGNKTFLDGLNERPKETNKAEGFLYGSSAMKRYEKNNPARRPNNKLMLEEITDSQRKKHQKLAADEDSFLTRYFETKARQKSDIVNEKRKDLEMLKEYNPWGKPGGGAPRGYRNNEVEANLTQHVKKLKQENHERSGAGGGGSPNRTSSGTVVTSVKRDPEIRFQAAQHNADIDPRLVMNEADLNRYKPDHSYGQELDALVKESLNRRAAEKRKNLEEEIRLIETNPFGSRQVNRALNKDATRLLSPSEDNVYDPWGKGYGGIPERKENGKLLKNLQALNNETKAKHLAGYGIPVKNSSDGNRIKGHVNSRKKETLSKNTYGQAFVRDFSPKETCFNPWGRPGAGAPLKDEHGNIMANMTGKLANDNREGSAQLKRDPVRRKEYLKSLEKQRQEAEALRKEERRNNYKPDMVDVANWVRQGKVGQPNYDSQTKEIRGNPKSTSDVTREKFQIRRLKDDNSKCYYEDLQEMANERNKRRQIEKTKERQLSFDHVKTMNNFWGRPGGGAPVIKDQSLLSRKHSEELLPTNCSVFR